MEGFYIILGLGMIYSWVHFIVLSLKKSYDQRSNYEVFITFFAIITFVLFIIGTLA